jgi:hypothetical protein
MIVAGNFTDWWSCLAGPLLGGAAAVMLCERVLRPGVPPQPRRTSQVPDAHHDRKSLLTETRGLTNNGPPRIVP